MSQALEIHLLIFIEANMELLFLALLIFIMAVALGSGYPVAFALPGAAIITVLLAAA